MQFENNEGNAMPIFSVRCKYLQDFLSNKEHSIDEFLMEIIFIERVHKHRTNME